ncbi:DUF4167 domain-containing protein [Rhizorhabdus wittichii]|uniref:DUF4167 domain-containing protein n=2 Tax=Rhizorhabdus wittichii TaxID=160791 RepID=A0A9J9HCF5_RHIWR|nr:DUF4167 domain-containing protein [Rhizorhabdus wittichii]ABQ68887.1 hypothetical protein Swit_2528 [Rhizorhabdus wittichii RW1]QTH20711.1 DUF4167 domain-containing protein [Rhizorhabdus wittichii]
MINNRQNGRRRGRGGGSGAPRPNGSNGGQDRGNRIDNRARGNAAQLLEKYKALARDAQMQGDRVNTEYYLQFADHYFRVLSESRSRFEDQQPRPRRDEFTGASDEEYGDEGDRIGADEQQPAPARAAGQERGFHRRDRDAEPRREREAEAEAPVAAPTHADGGDEDRRPRRGRPPRAERPVDAPSAAPELPLAQAAPEPAAAEEEPAAPVRRRGRPPKAKPAEAAEQIEVDRLPPSLTLQAPVNDGGEGDEAPRPRTRTRKPRGETAAA